MCVCVCLFVCLLLSVYMYILFSFVFLLIQKHTFFVIVCICLCVCMCLSVRQPVNRWASTVPRGSRWYLYILSTKLDLIGDHAESHFSSFLNISIVNWFTVFTRPPPSCEGRIRHEVHFIVGTPDVDVMALTNLPATDKNGPWFPFRVGTAYGDDRLGLEFRSIHTSTSKMPSSSLRLFIKHFDIKINYSPFL